MQIITIHVKRDVLLVSLFDMAMKINEVLKAYGIESYEIAIEIAEYWNGRPFKVPEYAKMT